MLKKLKCIEAAASLKSSSVTTTAQTITPQSSVNIKLIKTEPIDYDMGNFDDNLQTGAVSFTTPTKASCGIQQQQRYHHVQVQTVPPRQPTGLTTPVGTQKVILTPRISNPNNVGTTSGNALKHMYTQHITSNAQQPASVSTIQHIVRRADCLSGASDNNSDSSTTSCGIPQIIITRTVPTSHTHLSRRHSASPSHYQRLSTDNNGATSSVSVSPPPLHHQQQIQHAQSITPQQHVRVIRDGRLYEESAASSRRLSVSPPPLHHHTRSAPVSPVISHRYVSLSAQEQQQSQPLISKQSQQQHQMEFRSHSPPLNPSVSSDAPTSEAPVVTTATTNHSQKYSSSATLTSRKYVVTSARHINVISTNTQKQQQQQHPQHNFQQQQQQQQQQFSVATSNTTPSTSTTVVHTFRAPIVTSSSISSRDNNNIHSTSNLTMRPPPPPPPPKIKNTSTTIPVLSGRCSPSGLSNGSCEEPSSSIPDLEFDGTTVLCRVCGDKASGFHYGVHSCEGCKGFFRRSIQQKIQYRPCTKNQQCSILRINRNRCQYCRLKKCIAVGMSRDAVRFGRVPKREKARILAAMQQSTQNRGQQRALATELDDQPRLLAAVLRAHLETCEFTKEKVAAMRQRARECPSYSMPTLLACPLNPAPELQSEQEFSQRFAHVIRGVIDFAGMVPGFQLLTQDDKFTLLKAGLFDALFVRLICMFDSSINSIICLNGQVMRRDAIQNGANARFLVDSTFNFAERMNSMNLSDAEIGLFCAIVLITPDRPGLRNLELIEKMYSRLKSCLQTIITQNRPNQPDFMAKLLETMPDLRTLSTLHTEKLVVFRTEHKELLRQQMWTIDDEQSSNVKSPIESWDDSRIEVDAKSPLGSVTSTESVELDYTSLTSANNPHLNHNNSDSIQQHHQLEQEQSHHQVHQTQSSLATSAPLLAATLSSSCPIRNRVNSGSSGDSTADIDIVGSHAHLTQNGLTITPIVRNHTHPQLHHHLTGGPTHRYRKLDSPTDSGIESGNEKTECGSKTVSSGGSSSCSSPRSSVDEAIECNTDAVASNINNNQVSVSVSPIRSPQPCTTTSGNSSTLKRQIVEDMPVLKRVLQAPPLYDTNSLMDEAYKPHKKFRALRHREIESAEADASSSTTVTANNPRASPITTSISSDSTQISILTNTNPPPPTSSGSVQQILASPSAQTTVSLSASTHQQQQSQLHLHLTRSSSISQPSNQSSLSSTHSVLAKSLMAEPRMTPEQIKRSDIIQNYLMREQTLSTSIVPQPSGHGNRSPAPPQLQQIYTTSISSSNSNCGSPSTTTVTLCSPPAGGSGSGRWSAHSSVITTTCQRQQSVSPQSNGSSSSSVASSSTGGNCQYFQSPHSTSTSVSPPRPSPSQTNTTPRLLELQVDIADSQQPLNLSKKSPTPPPNRLHALVAAANAVQRLPTVSADVTVTPSTSPPTPSSPPTSSSLQTSVTSVHKVLLEA